MTTKSASAVPAILVSDIATDIKAVVCRFAILVSNFGSQRPNGGLSHPQFGIDIKTTVETRIGARKPHTSRGRRFVGALCFQPGTKSW